MAQKFDDRETQRLAAEIAKLAGESEEEALRRALRERLDRLEPRASGGRRPRTMEEMRRMMETKVWPLISEENRGKPTITKEEKEELLGYGPEGY